MVGLKISINGLALLKGDEIKDSMAAIDLLTDKDSNVVGIRGPVHVFESGRRQGMGACPLECTEFEQATTLSVAWRWPNER